MNFQAAINNAPSLNAFRTESLKDEAVALKKDGLQAQPAKLGFFGRAMQWLRGENPARINSDTKEAFVAAMSRKYGSKAADTALAKTGFYGGNDQPLTSREIKLAIGYANKQAAGGGVAPGSASGTGTAGAAQALRSATNDMLNTRAETVKLTQDVIKLSALVARCQISKDPRLGAMQAQLTEAKQSLTQTRSKLEGQAAQITSGALPVSTSGTAAQPPGSTTSVTRNDASARLERRTPAPELNSEARTQRNEQRAEMRSAHKQSMQEMRADKQKMRGEMREQAKLSREQSHAEQTTRHDERKADRVQQRELRAQARLEHNQGVQQNLQKMSTSAESLLAQTSHMVDQEFAALQAEIDEYAAKADAFSEALARPIGRR